MRKYISFALLIVCLGISIFFRMMPAFLPSTKNTAEAFVLSNIADGVKKEVEDKLKDLPAQAKFRAEQNLSKMRLKEQKKTINEAIRNKQREIKSYWQDESGQTFLLEIDPYHWFRLVGDIDRKIQSAALSQIRPGYDNFMLAPQGMKAQVSLHKNFHVYFSYFVFRLVRLFNKNIPLMSFVFYMPIFISSLALIAVFFFCASIRQSRVNISGFFASLALGFIPIFLRRSLGGWFDTDPYVILFSLLSVWTFFLSLKYAKRFYKAVLFALISGFNIGLFSFTWEGWWYIFDLLVFSALYYIANLYLIGGDEKEGNNLRARWILFSLFILSSFIFVGVFSGITAIPNFIFGPAKIIFSKGYLQNQFWPNAFLTVSELREEKFANILSQLGGLAVVFVSFLYLAVMVYKRVTQEEKQRQFIGFLFSFWLAIILYISIKAMRFSLLAIVPCVVSLGLFLAGLVDYLGLRLKRIKNMRYAKEAIFAASCAIFMLVFYDNAIEVKSILPLMNRDWWDVLTKLKTETPDDAVINSWWDYGHWFKAVAQRRVIFDGATQNTPLSYWMGRALLSDNEKEAYGILRMLNSGSNMAFEELEKLGIGRRESMDILNSIILMKKRDADTLLTKYVLNKKDRERILGYTHNPQPAYLIVEPSLIYKMPSLSFLGGWDFKKADIYRSFKFSNNKEKFINYLTKNEGYDNDDAAKLYDKLIFLNSKDALSWISPSSEYYRESRKFRKADNLLLFDNGFVVDLGNYRTYFDNIKQSKWDIPKSIFYEEAGLLKEEVFPDSDIDFSVLLLKEKDDYGIISLDSKIAKSMFTRLYFLSGLGLKSFHLVIKKEIKDKEGYILVYKIDWDEDI